MKDKRENTRVESHQRERALVSPCPTFNEQSPSSSAYSHLHSKRGVRKSVLEKGQDRKQRKEHLVLTRFVSSERDFT